MVKAFIASCILFAIVCPIVVLSGTSESDTEFGKLELVWGERGANPGYLQKPRAMAIDKHDNLYIVDKAARIQVFDRDGNFSHGWSTPKCEFGKPTGMSFDNDGNLMVADTHYYRVLFYSPAGELLEDKTIGGIEGREPGLFGWVTDCVQDSKGNYYVSEYGAELDRVQKFSPSGEYLWGWGSHGSGDENFRRPNNLAIDENDQLWIVDANNHRVLVFDVSGDKQKLVNKWGFDGGELGQLRNPYDLVLDREHVYICEFGNSRVQKFTREGKSLGTWGSEGRGEGELFNPWAVVVDSKRRLHVLDTYNQRIQRIRL